MKLRHLNGKLRRLPSFALFRKKDELLVPRRNVRIRHSRVYIAPSDNGRGVVKIPRERKINDFLFCAIPAVKEQMQSERGG